MKVYTRGGDGGETSLFGGERVSKGAARVEAYGAVDELNATLGVVLTALQAESAADLRGWLTIIQSSLFDLGGELATPNLAEREAKGKDIPRVRDRDVAELETWIDTMDGELTPLTSFVLPGGEPAAAHLHVSRTVCRRAERIVIRLAEHEDVPETSVRYLNRLSDFLFVMARCVNQRAGTPEPTWVGRERVE